MALSDVTTDGILRAIAEYEALGREAFLSKYGFGKSYAYKLVIDDREYDSKAIVGAAHGWSQEGLAPLTADAFSGGDATVRPLLERLGFEVRSKARNPDWSRDELILALDAYMTWRPSFPAKMSTEIAKLSAEVRALGELLHGVSSETFRNANGVYMKLMDLRRLEPGAGGEASGGLSGGSQADVEVWNAYAQNRTALATAAAAIRATLARVDADEDLRADLASADEPEIAEATEGALVTRLHRLGRDLSGRYGSEAYAMEECVADLAASFVLADLGIAHRPRPDHAAYLASWVKVLKHDPRAIFTAASKAQAVADWMTERQGEPPP